MDVALVTYSGLPDLEEDEQLLAGALAERGLRVGPATWDDPGVDWAGISVSVIRSTWDYHHRLDEFLAWVERVKSLTALWNPSEVVRWNSRKTYLKDLADGGIPIVPTRWLERGTHGSLATIMAEQGWQSMVVKPVVSASAYGTLLVTGETIEQGQVHLDNLVSERDMMIQPFMPSVETHGEHSLMFVEGKFTHAVRRVPAIGKDQYGHENARLAEVDDRAIAFATDVLSAAKTPTLYARVDVVKNDADELYLMELELVEPSLFLKEAPHTVETLADAIARCVS